MTLLVISPDFASHYTPLSVVARAASDAGERVVVATGPAMRARVLADGFEWRLQRLGASSNAGVVERTDAIDRFLAATRRGPIPTLRLQARDRAEDLLWEPATVARGIRTLCDELEPDHVLVDQVSTGSTLAMTVTGRRFVTLVPGHPTQLPVAEERYGIPSSWPTGWQPDPADLRELELLVDDVTSRFTERWNAVVARLAPDRPAVDDAFRVHGDRVLYNSVAAMHDSRRDPALPTDHHFVGPLTRTESMPAQWSSWARNDERPKVYVALGTFLSHRGDVLRRVADALRELGVRAAIATGPTPSDDIGPVPDDWLVAPQLPQVALLAHADVAIHHGGNNSVQEALAHDVAQVVLPFSTDQFANATDVERTGRGSVARPNTATVGELADIIGATLLAPKQPAVRMSTSADVANSLLGRSPVAA